MKYSETEEPVAAEVPSKREQSIMIHYDETPMRQQRQRPHRRLQHVVYDDECAAEVPRESGVAAKRRAIYRHHLHLHRRRRRRPRPCRENRFGILSAPISSSDSGR